MTTIVTRAGKGSPLTNNEVDANFTNLNDTKIETLTSTDTSVTITGTGASRDLSVPVDPNTVYNSATSTDNAIARFDGTTGKLIQNSVVTIDDTGNISGVASISSPGFIQLDTTAAASIALGKLRWNVDAATAAFGIIDGTTEVNMGQQMYAYVTNAESVTITAGQAVYLYQATGNRASVKLAQNTGDATSAKTLGLVTADIAAGQTGFVTTQGVLSKLNTGSFAEGNTLYLGATAGSLTATKPSAPNHLVYIGVVERANNGNGQIYVRPQNGYELDEIHDVQINSGTLANGQTILYDAATALWKNANLTAGTGISVTNGAGSVTLANTGVTSITASTGISVSSSSGDVTITNSAPDQTVALSSGTGISVTGTYPNFTVTNTAPSSGGTVTSITAGTGLTGGTITGTGTIAVSYGTSAGTACQGNDSRLSDARQATNTNTQLASLGVGTPASGTAGEIRATNNVTAYYSDDRLKTKLGKIENALDKVCALEGFYYEANETAQALGYKPVREVGLSAQSTQKDMPEIVAPAPISDEYLTVRYERYAPYFVEAIKELRAEIAELRAEIKAK